MKYDNNSLDPRKWTTAQLKKEAVAMNAAVNVYECYGAKDVLILDACLEELERRGAVPSYVMSFDY